MDLPAFFEALDAGDEDALVRWHQYLDDLAAGIHNLNMVFDVDVVLSGEVDTYLQRDLPLLTQRLQALYPFGQLPGIHISRYGANASAVGAALLPVDEFIASL